MTPQQITPAMTDAFNSSLGISGHDSIELYALSAALSAVLSLPEVRDAIHAEVRRELDAKLKAAGVTGYSLEF